MQKKREEESRTRSDKADTGQTLGKHRGVCSKTPGREKGTPGCKRHTPGVERHTPGPANPHPPAAVADCQSHDELRATAQCVLKVNSFQLVTMTEQKHSLSR
jgi:hypothetical protein